MLNRTIMWTPDGLEYHADGKHADRIINEYATMATRRVTTPATTTNDHDEDDDKDNNPYMDMADASRYRAAVARLTFLGNDR